MRLRYNNLSTHRVGEHWKIRTADSNYDLHGSYEWSEAERICIGCKTSCFPLEELHRFARPKFDVEKDQAHTTD